MAACLVAVFLFVPAQSIAQPCAIVMPSGLSPGDEYRLAFTTSGTRNAESTDIADYNAFVTAAANTLPELAALETQWFAIASTATVDARTNTGTTPPGAVPVYLLNDTLLATSYDDLWDWSIAAPFDYTELCAPVVGGPAIWTGTTGFGTTENPLGAANATTGSRTLTENAQWIRNGAGLLDQAYRFYAISAVLTTPAVPNESDSWGTVKAHFR